MSIETFSSPTTITDQTYATYDIKTLGQYRVMPYTDRNRQVWRDTLNARFEFNSKHGHPTILRGLKLFNISPERIPDLEEIENILLRETGWKIIETDRALRDADVWRLTAEKIRPITARIRPDAANSIAWPDMLHDIYHLFVLLEPGYAEFLPPAARLFVQACDEGDERMTNEMKRILWQFSEYGIVQTKDGYKAYGPILNETGEGEMVMQNQTMIRCGGIAEAAQLPIPWEFDPAYHVGRLMPTYLANPGFENMLGELNQWVNGRTS